MAAALFTIAPGEDAYSPSYELKLQKLHEEQSFHDISLKLPHLHCIDLGMERKVGFDEIHIRSISSSAPPTLTTTPSSSL